MAVSILTEFGSTEFYKYGQYNIGTYPVSLRVDGNAILSVLFVAALDPGASLTVQYYQQVRGVRDDLQKHEISETGTQSIIVGPQVNTPFVEAVVEGGSVTFALVGTARSDQPLDLSTFGRLGSQSEFTDDTGLGVKTIEMGPLVRVDYDEIVSTFLDDTTENYDYKSNGEIVATLQYTYREDGSFLSVKRLQS